MSSTISISLFLIGTGLVVAALLGARIKLAAVELPTLAGGQRIMAACVGAALISISILRPGPLCELDGSCKKTAAATAPGLKECMLLKIKVC